MPAFSIVKGVAGQREEIVEVPMAVSATVAIGDACQFINGKLKRCDAQADVVTHIAAENYTTTSTEFKKVKAQPVEGMICRNTFTPLMDDITATSGSTTTALGALTDGSSSDLVGGLIYIKQLDETRVISANTYSSNVVTITVVEPFSRAIAAGDSIRVVPFGYTDAALKLKASTYYDGVSTVRGDESGGKLVVRDVDMKRKTVDVQFLQV